MEENEKETEEEVEGGGKEEEEEKEEERREEKGEVERRKGSVFLSLSLLNISNISNIYSPFSFPLSFPPSSFTQEEEEDRRWKEMKRNAFYFKRVI